MDAGPLWGKTVWETEEEIKKSHQDPQIRVAAIGRAGEIGVLYAGIVNDLHRAAGRSGVGAVMGSKNLKAVAVRGTRTDSYPLANPKAFLAATEAAKKVLAANGVTGQGLPTYGTQVLMNVINELGALPTRNHRDIQFEGANDISGEAMHRKRPTDGKANLVTNGACFGCTIACGRISRMDPGHFTVKDKPQYQGASGGVEYEAAWALGAANGVSDLEALTYANFLCNEHGFDPISFGATVGAAMELYDLGILTKEEVGFELPFGSTEAMVKLAEMTARGEGFGKEIGMGSRRLCAKYGRPDLSMTVKGQEFPAYDGRGLQGMGLAYATSNRGACHLRGYMVSPEVLGIPVKMEPQATEGKAAMLKAFQDLTAVVDSAGICLFTTFAWGLADIQPQIQAACEGDWSPERLLLVGERIWNMEREFNLAAGLTAQGRLPAAAPDERGREDRPAEGGRVEARRDAAGVLPGAGLDGGGRPDSRDARAPRRLNDAGLAMRHVIIGSGPAGVIAAETLRKADPAAEITLLCGEGEPPYARMAIPYLLKGDIDEAGTYIRKDRDHYGRMRIDLVQARARAVDTAARVVDVGNGRSLPYDRLLVATGSRPSREKIPGIDLPGVRTCWTLRGRPGPPRRHPSRHPRRADGRGVRRLHHHGGAARRAAWTSRSSCAAATWCGG